MFTNIYVAVVGFLVSLFILLKSADYFTDAADNIGKHFRIPQFIIGVTIISIGTSLPELATSLFAVLAGNGEFVIGNVIGSNITNILLVVGFAAIAAKKLVINYSMEKVDLPLLVGSAIIAYIMLADGSFVIFEAIICIIGYLGYLWYLMSIKTNAKREKLENKNYWVLILGAIGVYIGAKYLVIAIQEMSVMAGFVDTSILALSVVALGTSLPELFVSLTAAKKQQYGIAMGNIVGSNIFNTFIVLGIPGLIGTLTITPSIIAMLPIFLGSTILIFVTAFTKEITKYEGLLLLLFYALFLAKVFSFF